MFKEGDLVVYPAQGIGKIEGIQSTSVDGQKKDFYIMRILDNDMRIMVPVQNANHVGVRQLIEKKDVPKVFEILKRKEISVSASTWNKRYREYMEKVKSGSIFELAEVFRDLNLLKEDKNLSFGERKMLDTTKSLIVKEIALVENEKEEVIERRINECFASRRK
ncbi:MAG TPA: CarD family transcriptional regulator [Thermodesulforhabdus norvegica]|uniref:CarD family transcriptional regulator n=1 Tax=Thermodesulforhabdus norvegica TaxID=39841 RepID=A0A7C0WTX6_9BACT|nr:CarD family transcriptional regulator [Thermodesulforhabdus norvegica]